MASKSVAELCEEVKKMVPAKYRDDCWYIIAATALIACGKPETMSDLYSHITKSGPSGELADSEKARISYRLRDVLMKEWTLVGIPLVVVAVVFLAKAEGTAEMANKELSAKWREAKFDKNLTDRGTNFIQAIYKENMDPIFASWGAAREDFVWMEKNIIYGLYLSDHTVLSDIETEMVTMTSIMCQGINAPTYWHIRGMRRLGMAAEDVESTQQAIENIAKWSGRSVEGWPRVSDVTEIID